MHYQRGEESTVFERGRASLARLLATILVGADRDGPGAAPFDPVTEVKSELMPEVCRAPASEHLQRLRPVRMSPGELEGSKSSSNHQGSNQPQAHEPRSSPEEPAAMTPGRSPNGAIGKAIPGAFPVTNAVAFVIAQAFAVSARVRGSHRPVPGFRSGAQAGFQARR